MILEWKIICKQPKSDSKSYIELIASYVHPKNSNHLRSHLRAIMALDHSRLGLENKFLENKSGRNFLRSTSLLYKILPTNLGACKPTFYTFYTSHLRWNSNMRHCFYHTDLGQNAEYFTIFQRCVSQNSRLLNCTHSIFEFRLFQCRSKHGKGSWAFSRNRSKNFQNHLYGQPVLTFECL